LDSVPELKFTGLPVSRFSFEMHNRKNLTFIFGFFYPVNNTKRKPVQGAPSIVFFLTSALFKSENYWFYKSISYVSKNEYLGVPKEF